MSKTNAFQKVGHKDRRQGQHFYNVTRVFGGSSSQLPFLSPPPSPAFLPLLRKHTEDVHPC